MISDANEHADPLVTRPRSPRGDGELLERGHSTPNCGNKAISFRSPSRATLFSRMLETVSLRRWSAAIQTVAVLVAIAIITRSEPSPSSGAASYTVHRQSSSVQAARVVAHEPLAQHPGKAVRFTGPWPLPLITGDTTVRGQIRECSSRGIAPASSAADTCYDATAPPKLLPT